jgi:hypothetical protein
MEAVDRGAWNAGRRKDEAGRKAIKRNPLAVYRWGGKSMADGAKQIPHSVSRLPLTLIPKPRSLPDPQALSQICALNEYMMFI